MKSTLATHYENVFKDCTIVGCGCDPGYLHPDMESILTSIVPEQLRSAPGSCSPLPPDLEGCVVLELGCGSGRNVFAAAQLVGPEGRVIGVDMRDDLLKGAKTHVRKQMKKLGFDKTVVDFIRGYPEDLLSLGVADNSVDVVVTNEIINLAWDKRAVFSEIFRVLKPGGELCFTTVLADRRLPECLSDDVELQRAGLAGALYAEDFRRLLRDIGCHDYRHIKKQPVWFCEQMMLDRVGLACVTYRTIRTFKLPLEDICEDYGQVAVYKGTMPGFPKSFPLDDHHEFITGKPMLVCGNTGAMVAESRFGKHFTLTGDMSVHYGPFDCS